MIKYKVQLTSKAIEDVDGVYDYILNVVFAPIAAANYYNGLIDTMRSLAYYADIHPIEPELSAQYEIPIRRIKYKKMAILYSIKGEIVNIHRVIPSSMIIY